MLTGRTRCPLISNEMCNLSHAKRKTRKAHQRIMCGQTGKLDGIKSKIEAKQKCASINLLVTGVLSCSYQSFWAFPCAIFGTPFSLSRYCAFVSPIKHSIKK